jgi:hypothetical protein
MEAAAPDHGIALAVDLDHALLAQQLWGFIGGWPPVMVLFGLCAPADPRRCHS